MSIRLLSARLALGLLAGILVAVIACGGEKVVVTQVVTQVVEKPVEKIVQQTVIVEKPVEKIVQQTVIVEKPVEKVVTQVVVATPTATRVAIPTATPAKPIGPTGKLTVAVPAVGIPGYIPSRAGPPIDGLQGSIGLNESLLSVNEVGEPISRLATSWTLGSDSLSWTFKLRQGVKFHKSLGEMTADDVKWSFDDAARPDTQGDGRFSQWIDRIEVVDKYTLIARTKGKQAVALSLFGFNGGGMPVISKAYIDSVGRDVANAEAIGTGPFEFVEHRPDDVIRAKAVEGHWRKTPGFADLQVIQVPEEAARVAMMKTGEADIAMLGSTSAIGLKGVKGMRFNESKGGAWMVFFPAGAFYDPTAPARPYTCWKHTPPCPWVGNPDDPNSMEKARKVRWAMATAIDRQTIVDRIYGGYGRPVYAHSVIGTWLDRPESKRWAIPFDPQKAKQYLTEAGYPTGFEMPVMIPTEFRLFTEEVAEATLAVWESIGIKSKIQKFTYSSIRPKITARTLESTWFFNAAMYAEPLNSWTPGTKAAAFNIGMELPKIDQYITEVGQIIDIEQRWKATVDVNQWFYDNMWTVPIAQWNAVHPYGPRIAKWTLSGSTTFNPHNMEYVEPAP